MIWLVILSGVSLSILVGYGFGYTHGSKSAEKIWKAPHYKHNYDY